MVFLTWCTLYNCSHIKIKIEFIYAFNIFPSYPSLIHFIQHHYWKVTYSKLLSFFEQHTKSVKNYSLVWAPYLMMKFKRSSWLINLILCCLTSHFSATVANGDIRLELLDHGNCQGYAIHNCELIMCHILLW